MEVIDKPAVQVVAQISVQINVLRRGHGFGYELMLGHERITGWTTQDGLMLHSPLHAWRRALKRCKDQGVRAPGLT